MSTPIPTLYEDDACIVVNKPANLVVHPANTTDKGTTLIEILNVQQGAPLHLVHRLDKDTTGCLLLAKTQEHCDTLQAQFKNREVTKKYLALCYGIPEQKKAIIDAPIGRNLLSRTKMSLFKTSTSREAKTTYTVLAEGEDCALLECEIHTGRTHQIRVHVRSINHPILGDEKYGTHESVELSKKYGIESLCLHARSLTFVSPMSKKQICVEAPIPAHLQREIDVIQCM